MDLVDLEVDFKANLFCPSSFPVYALLSTAGNKNEMKFLYPQEYIPLQKKKNHRRRTL
jgi:hypothetical protein